MKKTVSELVKKISFTKNIPQKIFSIVFAIVLWLVIMDYENPEMVKTFRDIPIIYQGAEALETKHLVAESDLNETIDVTLRGRRKDILNTLAEDISATVDLSTAQKGHYDFPVKVSEVSKALTIQGYSKSALSISFDVLIDEVMTIEVLKTGELPSSYYVIESRANPSLVKLHGPKKTIASIVRVLVRANVEGAQKSFTEKTDVLILDSDGKIVEDINKSIESTNIKTTIGKEKKVDLNVQYGKFKNENLVLIEAKPSNEKLLVKGEVDLVETLKVLYTEQVVMPEQAGQYKIPLLLKLPEGIALSEKIPLYVDLNITAYETREYKISNAQVQFENLIAGRAAYLPDDFEHVFQIKGLIEDLDRFDSANIQVVINAEGLDFGMHTSALSFTLPKELELIESTEKQEINFEIVEKLE